MSILNSILKFHLPQKSKQIFLKSHTTSPYQQFTFLESNLKFPISRNFNEKNYFPVSKQVKQYSESVLAHKKRLLQVQQEQILSIGIDSLLHEFKQVATSYQNAQKYMTDLLDDISGSQENFSNLVLLASIFNMISFKLWNKILIKFYKGYENSSISSKHLNLSLVYRFFQKFANPQFQRGYSYKFMYLENHMNDLIYVNEMLERIFPLSEKLTFGKEMKMDILANEEKSIYRMEMEVIEKKNNLIRKIQKATNINSYLLKDLFFQNKNSYLLTLTDTPLKYLISLFQFASNCDPTDREFAQKLEEQILKKIQPSDISFKTINQILQIWKNQCRHNEKFYNTTILPYLQQSISKNWQNHKESYINISFKIICCGIKNYDIIRKILSLFKAERDSKDLHILRHYLKIKDLENTGTPLEEGIKFCSESQKFPIQPIEFNPTEDFWYKIIKSINNIECFPSKYFCVYQIDILVTYNGKYFGFEIQGFHYKDKNKGKKMIKKQILKSFGIEVIDIHCEEDEPKAIMRFNRSNAGRSYIVKILEERLKQVQSQC